MNKELIVTITDASGVIIRSHRMPLRDALDYVTDKSYNLPTGYSIRIKKG
jgi:hypothetical protein